MFFKWVLKIFSGGDPIEWHTSSTGHSWAHENPGGYRTSGLGKGVENIYAIRLKLKNWYLLVIKWLMIVYVPKGADKRMARIDSLTLAFSPIYQWICFCSAWSCWHG